MRANGKCCAYFFGYACVNCTCDFVFVHVCMHVCARGGCVRMHVCARGVCVRVRILLVTMDVRVLACVCPRVRVFLSMFSMMAFYLIAIL